MSRLCDGHRAFLASEHGAGSHLTAATSAHLLGRRERQVGGDSCWQRLVASGTTRLVDANLEKALTEPSLTPPSAHAALGQCPLPRQRALTYVLDHYVWRADRLGSVRAGQYGHSSPQLWCVRASRSRGRAGRPCAVAATPAWRVTGDPFPGPHGVRLRWVRRRGGGVPGLRAGRRGVRLRVHGLVLRLRRCAS